jgi:dolichol-phosphate mannosyltransferase
MSKEVYSGHRVLGMFPFHNERAKLQLLVQRFRPGLVDKFLPVDDGSTDGGVDILRRHGLDVLRQPHRTGIGACIKRCVRYAQENDYDILVVMAGNNKDDPAEIPRLVTPIVHNGYDYVQGSRFLPGGTSHHLPRFRRVMIRLLSLIFTLYTRRRCTDITNGFRAYRVSLFDDPSINIWQDWLDDYEYEYYVQWKVFTLRYRVLEVPVSKVYPGVKGTEYTKIRPIFGWWRMLRPFIFLALRIKH